MLNYLWCVKNLPVQFLAPTRHTCTFQTRLAFCNLQNLQGCIFDQLGTWIGSLLFLRAFLLRSSYNFQGQMIWSQTMFLCAFLHCLDSHWSSGLRRKVWDSWSSLCLFENRRETACLRSCQEWVEALPYCRCLSLSCLLEACNKVGRPMRWEWRIDKTGRAYFVAMTTHQISSARLQKHKKGWTPKPQSHFSNVEDGWLIWDQLLAKEIKSEIEKTWISEGFFQSNALQTLSQFLCWSHIRHKRKDWDWNRDILDNLMVKFPYLLSLPGYQA